MGFWTSNMISDTLMSGCWKASAQLLPETQEPRQLGEGHLALDVPCLLTQEFGTLLTSELAQGQVSMALLPSRVSSGKAALEQGATVAKSQLGLGLASDVGRGEAEDHLCSVWTLLPGDAEQKGRLSTLLPPPSSAASFLGSPRGTGRLFLTRRVAIG